MYIRSKMFLLVAWPAIYSVYSENRYDLWDMQPKLCIIHQKAKIHIKNERSPKEMYFLCKTTKQFKALSHRWLKTNSIVSLCIIFSFCSNNICYKSLDKLRKTLLRIKIFNHFRLNRLHVRPSVTVRPSKISKLPTVRTSLFVLNKCRCFIL